MGWMEGIRELWAMVDETKASTTPKFDEWTKFGSVSLVMKQIAFFALPYPEPTIKYLLLCPILLPPACSTQLVDEKLIWKIRFKVQVHLLILNNHNLLRIFSSSPYCKRIANRKVQSTHWQIINSCENSN